MNINKKAHSLYQSMDRWILLYRRIHECDHNTAHDAFDEMADALPGVSADQSTPEFHEAVDLSYTALLKANPPPGVVVLDKPAHKEVSYTNTKGETVTSKPIGNLVGGPLLELSYGKQEPRRKFGKAEFGGPAAVVVSDNAPIGGPILDTGKDPLSFKDEYNPENLHWGQKTTFHETDVSALEERVVKELLGCSNPMPKIDTAEEARVKAEKAIEVNTGFLVNTKHPHDHPSVVKAREVIAAARTFLTMLGGVEERTKGRKTLSLPKK